MYAWIDMAALPLWSALIGGLIIGLAASVLIVGSGHIMGMSGILKSSLLSITHTSLAVGICDRYGGSDLGLWAYFWLSTA